MRRGTALGAARSRRSGLRQRSPRTLPSSRALEQEVADTLKGRRSVRSGGVWTQVGDVQTGDLLAECKERTSRGSKSFTILREWLDKVSQEAAQEGAVPALVFRFRGDTRKWVVLPFEFVADRILAAAAQEDAGDGAEKQLPQKGGESMQMRDRDSQKVEEAPEIPKMVGWWESETEGFRELVLRILASLPGGEELEALGYEPLPVGWKELELLQELASSLQEASDVRKAVDLLLGRAEVVEP